MNINNYMDYLTAMVVVTDNYTGKKHIYDTSLFAPIVNNMLHQISDYITPSNPYYKQLDSDIRDYVYDKISRNTYETYSSHDLYTIVEKFVKSHMNEILGA